jgi:PAS domain S-box-containing protein
MPTNRPDQVSPGVVDALHQIGVAIASALEPLGLARCVAEHARALLSADAVGLWVLDEQIGSLRPLHVENWEHPAPLASQSSDPPGVVAVPLVVGGRTIGRLGVGFAGPHQVTPAEVVTLNLLAAEVAPAFEAARLSDVAHVELAERRRTEDVLRFQAQLLEAVEHALIALDLDGTIRYWNAAAENLYGWRAEDVLGRNAREILVPGGLSAQRDEIVSRLVAGETWSGEFLVRRRDGTVVPALVSDSPVRDAEGRLIGLIGASIDVSERVKVTHQLEESEQRFRSMFEHELDAVFAFDRSGRVTLANPACERLSGYTVQEILAEPRAYAPPGEYERGAAFFQAALRSKPQRFESVIVHKDGHYVDVWTTQIPIVVDGQVTGVFGIAKDITERRKAREALRASEQRFRAVWEHSADAMVLTDTDWIIQRVNPACCALYDLSADELIGHDIARILPEVERTGVERRRRELFAAPEPPPTVRSVVRRSDGEERIVECHAEFVSQGGDRVGMITIIRDVTERVQAEQERETLLQALAAAQQRVQELLPRVLRPAEYQARSERRADVEARVASLTPRELDVLRLLAVGRTNPDIGRALGLSPKAARNRVAHVLAKLGVSDRTHAAVLAVELGLASPTSHIS